MSAAAAHKPEHDEAAHDEHAEGGHAEAGHAEPAAANNSDFIAEGGVVPLVRDIGKLLLGVTIQAPIDAARGGATADPKHAKHPPEGKHDKAHDKAHPKKEADAAGAAPGGHAGHSAEATSDYLAAAQSIGKVLEEFLDGKVDKHSVEHAVDHWLDARNFGLARPFAGTIAKASVWGLNKIFKLRDHALEKLDPQWETLGRQILTGLPHDEKHGYHAGVENLCHTMKSADIEDNFSKLLSETAFDAAMKTNGGQKAIQKQIARWMGTSDQPDAEQLNKRIDAILKILKLEHEAKPGLWGRFVGLFKSEKKEEEKHGGHDKHGHHHEHVLDDPKAEKNRQVLLGMLKLLKKKCTDANLTMIYEGQVKEVDLDQLGDKVQEVASQGDAARISFVSSLREGPIKAKFKKLIELDRLKVQLKTPKGREELRGLLKSLHDLESESTLTVGELDTEYNEYFGPKGALKEKENYPNPSLALDNYLMLRRYMDQIHQNLKLEDPNNPDQSVVDAIYEDPVVVKYEEFGNQLNDLDPSKAKKFAKAYSEKKFRLNFGMLLSKDALTQACSKEATRKFALDRVVVFLGLKSGLADQVEVQSVLSGWDTTFALAGLSDSQLQKDIKTASENINNPPMLKLLTEGPEKGNIYADFPKAFKGDISDLLNQFDSFDFQTNFSYLVRGENIGDLDPTQKAAAKAECKRFFGSVPLSEDVAKNMVHAMARKIQARVADWKEPRSSLGLKANELINGLSDVLRTVSQENLDKINAA